jgi:MFS transporter, DHA1 family, multidrug resistance protein
MAQNNPRELTVHCLRLASPAVESSREHVFWMLAALNFLITLGVAATDPFLPAHLRSNGAGGLSLGIVFSGYTMSRILMAPIIGRWSDRCGRTGIIMAGIAFQAAAAAGYMNFSDLRLIILVRLLQGTGIALFKPVIQAFAAETVSSDRRGKALGTFDISFYAGLAAGPFLGGIICDSLGFTRLCGMVFLTCAGALAISAGLPSTADSAASATTHSPSPAKILAQRNFIALLGFIFTKAVGITTMSMFLPLFMMTCCGLNSVKTGVVVALGTIVMTLLLRPSGHLSDRSNKQSMVVCGGLLSALFIMLVPLMSDFKSLAVLAALKGVFDAFSQPASSALLAELGDRHGMGAATGIFQSVMNAGMLAGPFVGGVLFETVGINIVFLFAGCLGLLGAAFFSMVMSRKPPAWSRE